MNLNDYNISKHRSIGRVCLRSRKRRRRMKCDRASRTYIHTKRSWIHDFYGIFRWIIAIIYDASRNLHCNYTTSTKCLQHLDYLLMAFANRTEQQQRKKKQNWRADEWRGRRRKTRFIWENAHSSFSSKPFLVCCGNKETKLYFYAMDLSESTLVQFTVACKTVACCDV